MEIKRENWLAHLEDLPDDISGYKTCTYLMALEGWRRGLKLTFRIRSGIAIPPSVQVMLSNGERTHVFTVSRGDKVTEEAINICSQKELTYKYLRQNNVPIPEGNNFSVEDSDEQILSYAESLGYPLVVKPTNAGSGRGVHTNIKNKTELISALEDVRERLGFKDVIVERFIKGDDYRIYVIDNQVVGAFKREISNVIGDGEKTIKELIEIKNSIRKKSPFIRNRMIKMDKDMEEFLKRKNLTFDSIPQNGEKVFLRPQGVRLAERDAIDVTDELSEGIKDIAVNAVKSIPGLAHCNVDMLIDNETGKGYVNEINSRPQIGNHLFPMQGKARDIPRKIIDFYFPETKDGFRNDNYYFDFNLVYEAFRNKSIRELTIPQIPKNHILVQYRIRGKLKNTGYASWVRRQAIRENLYGYVKYVSNNEVLIVVSGRKRRIENFKSELYTSKPKRAKIDEIVEEGDIRVPVKIGFYIITDKKNKSGNKITKKVMQLKKQIKNYEIERKEILNSTSWKITKPLRILGKMFKNKKK